MISPEEVDALSDRCFNAAASIVGRLVDLWRPAIQEQVGDERRADLLIRGIIGSALLTVAVSQLRKVRLDKTAAQEQFDDAWEVWEDDVN